MVFPIAICGLCYVVFSLSEAWLHEIGIIEHFYELHTSGSGSTGRPAKHSHLSSLVQKGEAKPVELGSLTPDSDTTLARLEQGSPVSFIFAEALGVSP